MDENILTGLALDEPVALAGVEPLYDTLFSHCFLTFFFLKVIAASATPPAVNREKGPHNTPAVPSDELKG